MANLKAIIERAYSAIERAYSAFNKRDIDGVLALMTEDVSWPKASEGGKVVGKEEIRAYWTRQWCEFDPHVEPLAISAEDGVRVRVKVHQLVKSLDGDVVSDSEVLHVFTIKRGLIAAMDLGDAIDTTGPTAAFAHLSGRALGVLPCHSLVRQVQSVQLAAQSGPASKRADKIRAKT